MLKAILLMLLSGANWTLVGILFGRAPEDRERLYSFVALNGILYTAFVWLTDAPAAGVPAGEVLRLAALIVPSALMEVFAFLLLKIAMNRGSQGIAWCIAQSAMAVSFVCSIVFLRNPSSAAQWAGMVLSLVSLVLFARDKPAKEGASNDMVYLLCSFGSFALIGVGNFLRLVPGYAGLSPEALTWRLPLQTPVAMVFWTAVCLAKGIWKPGRVWRQSVPYAANLAVGGFVFYAATDAADKLRITSVVVPVVTGTCILLFALWCHFFRGERLSRGGWVAVALNVAGLALLSS